MVRVVGGLLRVLAWLREKISVQQDLANGVAPVFVNDTGHTVTGQFSTGMQFSVSGGAERWVWYVCSGCVKWSGIEKTKADACRAAVQTAIRNTATAVQ